MNDFIRGSQVTLHRIRMFWQAMKVITTVSMIWIVVSLCCGFWLNTTASDWSIAFHKAQSDFAKMYNPNKLIEFKTPRGHKIRVMARYFNSNYYAKLSSKSMHNGLNASITIAVAGVGASST